MNQIKYVKSVLENVETLNYDTTSKNHACVMTHLAYNFQGWLPMKSA